MTALVVAGVRKVTVWDQARLERLQVGSDAAVSMRDPGYEVPKAGRGGCRAGHALPNAGAYDWLRGKGLACTDRTRRSSAVIALLVVTRQISSGSSRRAHRAHGYAPLPEPIRVRIGLNAGEPVAEDKDLFGTAMQLAARVCAQAEPGRILVPEGVRHLVAGKGFLFSDRGVVALRGFEDPVRLYEVRWREET